ncbi:MAG: hypothetical protein D6702_05520 [Planctomycetota bacterium]|nr:MAG: hypothetical protein D6702_05520 [Planctomycetota bacterium]
MVASSRVLSLLALCGFVLATANLGATFLLKSGNPKDGRAAAPPDFQDCSDCHDQFAVGSGGGTLVIAGPNGSYTPGAVYPMTVTIDRPGSWRWGFEIVALDHLGNSAGLLTPVDNNTQVSVRNGITYLKQTSAGTFNGHGGPVTWNFQWTAPAAGTGPVRFYASSVAGDANFSSSGDYVYDAAYALAEGAGDASVTVQPYNTTPRQGSTWTVPVFVTNSSGGQNQVYLVTRVDLGNGRFYPSTGWLSGPTLVDLPAGANQRIELTHTIPATAPLITASYQAIVGRPPGTLVDLDSFSFTITP